MIYNIDVKLKIGHGAEYIAKISRKRSFWTNLGLSNATIDEKVCSLLKMSTTTL